MRISAHLTAIACALALSACGTTEGANYITGTTSEPPPADYKRAVRDYMRQSLFDPYSVRDVSIAKPKNGGSGMYPGWTVCFRANAKNRIGAYTGQQITAVIFQRGVIVDAQTENGWMFCNGVTYEPFPEFSA